MRMVFPTVFILPFAALLAPLTSASPLNIRAAPNVTAESFSQTKFDYVIVGGGTAGLVVAARLSEDPKVTVGVIEAGLYLPEDPNIDNPANIFNAVNNPKYDWNFDTVPQPGLGGRQIKENRGKILGGSSAINAAAFHRPSAPEFDSWGTTFGNGELWTWKNIEPYFKKAENWTGPPPLVYPGAEESPSLPGAHGTNGQIILGYNDWYADELKTAISAAANLGIELNNNPDSGNGTGFFNVPRSVDPNTGRRSYAAPAYYTPFRDRSNYVVLTGAFATKINFDSAKQDGKLKATGVSFTVDGQAYTVNATEEVILSAGALQTPQLLELSGVGNTTLLSSLGIETLVDLPFVGENFLDHTITFGDSINQPGQITLDLLAWNETYRAEQEALFNERHRGPIGYSSAAIAVVPAHKLVEAQALETMKQTLISSNIIHRTPLSKIQYDESLQFLEEGNIGWTMLIAWPGGGQASKRENGTTYLGHHALNYRPFSRGYVHINSTDPTVPPVIDPNFFGVEFDLELCAQQFSFIRKWTTTSPLSETVAKPNSPPADADDFEELKTYCRTKAGTTWHPMGSTAMAPLEKGGVVNNRLIVHGLLNVRIVDAGVIPQTIGAAPQPTVYMIAEKAADIIKEDANASRR